MRTPIAAVMAAGALLLFGPSCKRRAPKTPPPPAPQQTFEPPPPIRPAPVPMEEPAAADKGQPPAALPQPPVPPAVEQLPPPPKPARQRRPAPRPAAPKPEEPPAPAAPAETAPAPNLRLGEVLPDDVAAQYERQLAADAAAAREVLAQARGRRLSREQSDLAARIRNFLEQAERIRQRDLASAAALGRRAALLAGELARTLR